MKPRFWDNYDKILRQWFVGADTFTEGKDPWARFTGWLVVFILHHCLVSPLLPTPLLILLIIILVIYNIIMTMIILFFLVWSVVFFYTGLFPFNTNAISFDTFLKLHRVVLELSIWCENLRSPNSPSPNLQIQSWSSELTCSAARHASLGLLATEFMLVFKISASIVRKIGGF